MIKATKALGSSAIALLLARLAAGCGAGQVADDGPWDCGEDQVTVYPLDAAQLAALDAEGDCGGMCYELGTPYADHCEWGPGFEGDPTGGSDGSSSGAESLGATNT